MLKAVSSVTNAIGALNYKGTWDASSNSPTLASGVGTKGDYYVVSVAGTTTLDGISSWNVGDWAVFNGSVWQRLEGGVDDPAPSLKSNSTTGLMQITGPADGQTRVVTIPNANATMARTDAGQTFTGNQQFSNSVGVGGAPNVQFEVTSASGGVARITGTSGTIPQVQIVSGGVVNWSLRTNQNGGSDFTIYQDSVERILVASGGDTTIKTGDLLLGTAGKGIKFSGNGNVLWRCGSGSPEGAVSAPVGSLYTRTDGGAGTTLYVKETGSGNTGWVAK